MVSFSSLACAVLAAGAASAARVEPGAVHQHSAEFLQFTREHAKNYCGEAAMPCKESLMREAVYQENAAFVAEHNSKYEAGESSYYVAINKVRPANPV